MIQFEGSNYTVMNVSEANPLPVYTVTAPASYPDGYEWATISEANPIPVTVVSF